MARRFAGYATSLWMTEHGATPSTNGSEEHSNKPGNSLNIGTVSPLTQLCAVALLCLVVPGSAQAETCRNKSFNGAAYIACSFDPAKQDLRLFWRGPDGKPYQTFAALARDLKSKGKSLHFAMNGGLYQNDFQPVGLYVENGRELTRANST